MASQIPLLFVSIHGQGHGQQGGAITQRGGWFTMIKFVRQTQNSQKLDRVTDGRGWGCTFCVWGGAVTRGGGGRSTSSLI